MTTWYLYFQREPESEWFIDQAKERDHLEKEAKVPFTTVLDVDTEITEDTSPEDVWKACYRGPLYIDLDCNDAEEVCDQFKKLLNNLEKDFEVDLHQVYLYATGGRGYHIVIPPQMFMEKIPPRGITALPLVYLDMVDKLYVDTVDLKIYSARRGRMFRVPNVKRTNGKFKVQLTVEEAKSMTVEMYNTLCSSPRHLPAPKAPQYNKKLALLFVRAMDVADTKLKQIKNHKGDEALLRKYDGKMPPTVQMVMEGKNLSDNAGFQKIATQLAVAAAAVNMPEDEFLKQCEGLIQNHKGDSQRYSSPAKRKAELKRMWMYMQGNPTYKFSAGAIKSLLTKDAETPDLDNAIEADDEAVEEEQEFSLSHGLTLRRDGIFKKTEDGNMKVSALGMSDAKQLLDIDTGEVHGYDVKVYVDGKNPKGRVISMSDLTSRANFLKFCLSAHSCNIAVTDMQVAALSDILRVRTEKNMNQVFTVTREGLDVIQFPDGARDIIWADQYGVESSLGRHYRLTGSMTDALSFQTDLRNAPPLENTEETKLFFENLFKVNQPDVIARIFGWFSACFLCQPIRILFTQFPFLQVFGPAGSGKSQTVRLFGRLHYYTKPVEASSALDATPFVYQVMATAGGSMPFILDEYKPSEMRKDILERSKGIIRSNYNGDPIGKGSINSTTGQSKLVVNKAYNRTPICVISEAMITQTAQLERCILVPVSKETRSGRTEFFDHCQAHGDILGQLGNMMRATAQGIQFDAVRKYVLGYTQKIKAEVGADLAEESSRPIFNIAVGLTGLEFARRILHHVFGDHFEEAFTEMRDSLTKNVERLVPRVVSEATKVLSTLAFLTTYDGFDGLVLNSGTDFLFDPTRREVILNLRSCWTKYAAYMSLSREKPLYDSYEAFRAGLGGHSACVDHHCVDNPLKTHANVDVFALSMDALAKDGVQHFGKD